GRQPVVAELAENGQRRGVILEAALALAGLVIEEPGGEKRDGFLVGIFQRAPERQGLFKLRGGLLLHFRVAAVAKLHAQKAGALRVETLAILRGGLAARHDAQFILSRRGGLVVGADLYGIDAG